MPTHYLVMMLKVNSQLFSDTKVLVSLNPLVKVLLVSKLVTVSFVYTLQNVVNVNSVNLVRPIYVVRSELLKVKV